MEELALTRLERNITASSTGLMNGVKQVRSGCNKAARPEKSDMPENFRERADLTKIIKSILDSYPSNGILRELLQNSDDAKATTQVSCLASLYSTLLTDLWILGLHSGFAPDTSNWIARR